MKEINVEKLQELENNQEFVTKLSEAKSSQDVVKVMREFGIDITEEEFKDGYQRAVSIFEEKGYMKNGELTESGLDMVAGGMKTWVSGAGITMGCVGLGLMMSGPIGWGAVALWAGGCAIGLIGVCV